MPSIPLAPRLESTRGGSSRAAQNVSTSRTGIDEATNERRVAPAARAELARDARLAELVAERRGDRRARRARRRARQRAEPGRSAGARPLGAARASAAPGRRRARGRTTPRRVLPGALGVEGDLRARRGRASHARSGLEVGRSPTRSTTSGRVRGGERARRAAARRSGRSPPAPRRAPDSGSASSGQPRAAANARDAPRRAPSAALVRGPATTTPRGAAGESASAQRRRRRAGAPAARDPGRAVGAGRRRLARQRLVEHQRLAQREVEVHRARAAATRASTTARQASARIQRSALRRRLVRADLEEPLDRVAVELELVDRLPGADVAQLGRPVGGQHDQRDAAPRAPRSPRAGSCAAAVPRRAGQRRRARRSPWRCRARRTPAPRSSTCDQHGQPPVAREREHQRRRARARATCTRRRTPQRASSSTNARRSR